MENCVLLGVFLGGGFSSESNCAHCLWSHTLIPLQKLPWPMDLLILLEEVVSFRNWLKWSKRHDHFTFCLNMVVRIVYKTTTKNLNSALGSDKKSLPVMHTSTRQNLWYCITLSQPIEMWIFLSRKKLGEFGFPKNALLSLLIYFQTACLCLILCLICFSLLYFFFLCASLYNSLCCLLQCLLNFCAWIFFLSLSVSRLNSAGNK